VIREHAFNARWWGAPVGIVEEPATFFAAPAEARQAALEPFAWTEVRVPAGAAWDRAAAASDGFVAADVQIGFRIGLRRLPAPGPSTQALQVVPAVPFAGRRLAPFGSERFHVLGAPEDLVDARFAAWAEDLRTAAPDWCFEVRSEDEPQGFFCSTPAEGGLHLALAGLYRDATVSGALVYGAALHAYAARGARSGWAAFSARNHAVHNVYASLGARFVSATEIWIRP
jgi:hypothetical protein